MEALWAKSPLSADEIIQDVRRHENWGEATVKTLIHRLLRKKAILSEREGGRHAYRPLVARAEYLQSESQGLLDRLFGGQLTPLIAHFAEHRRLKPDEIERLRKLVEEFDDDD